MLKGEFHAFSQGANNEFSGANPPIKKKFREKVINILWFREEIRER
jgi:hypothetical protein